MTNVVINVFMSSQKKFKFLTYRLRRCNILNFIFYTTAIIYLQNNLPVFALENSIISHDIDQKPSQTLEGEQDPDTDPNENLGTDSKFIASFKLDGYVNFPLGLTLDYYLWNSPDSKHHVAVAAGVDTIQFKYFYPMAEVRYEWGTNHRLAVGMKYSLLYIEELLVDGLMPYTETIKDINNPNIFPVHGFTLLAGYTHQGNNRLFFSALGGLSLSIDNPAKDLYGGKFPEWAIQSNVTFEIKLGFRFI